MKSQVTNFKLQGKKGFTLLEVLLVVAVIGILAGIVILAINPNKQLGDTRNAQRRADVNTILNAVYQYSIDNRGNLPTTIASSTCVGTTATSTEIWDSSTATTSVLIDLSVLVANQRYLTAIPVDPSGATTTGGTGYRIARSANGRVTVCAVAAESETTISVTR